jgi:uncharacterized protein (DUF4213/DUF364 family)
VTDPASGPDGSAADRGDNRPADRTDGAGQPHGILDRVWAQLRGRAARASDPDVTLGRRALAVGVTDPSHGRLVGLAHRPAANSPDGTDANALGEIGVATDAGTTPAPSPGTSASVTTLANAATEGATPLARAVGVATLNALSVPDLSWRVGDPMAAVTTDVDVVTTVGLFRPAFRKFGGVTVRVVEREPPAPEAVRAPDDVTVETYEPDACVAAFTDADVCFLTGSTLVYGGIDRYLSALRKAGVAPVVLVGATASHLPDPAFEAGVDVVAGARIPQPVHDRVLARVRAGDCGTDLHDAGVEKVYAIPSDGRDLPGLQLPADTDPDTVDGRAGQSATQPNTNADPDTDTDTNANAQTDATHNP